MDRMNFNVRQGTFQIDFGGMLLKDLHFGFDYSIGVQGEIRSVLIDAFAAEVRNGVHILTGTAEGFRMTLTAEDSDSDGLIRLGADITNGTGGDIRLWNLNLITAEGSSGNVFGVPGGLGGLLYYAYSRRYEAGIAGFPSVCESDNAYVNAMWAKHTVKWYRHFDPIYDRENWYVSVDFGGIYAKSDGRGIFAGFHSPGAAFGEVCVKMLGDSEGLCVRSRMDGVLLSPGESRTAENAVLRYGTPYESSEIWAKLCVDAMGARKKFAPLSGYCSWYRLYGRINAEEIDAAVDQYSKLPRKADLIQIDSGYEITPGDWEANAKFPDGMRRTAEKIAEAGFIPGIWTSPMFLHESSATYRAHPDWIQRLANGEPAASFPLWKNGGALFMDPTKPECMDFMRQSVRKMTEDWGFRYLKFDFIYGTVFGIDYHDPRKTAFQMMRAMYENFREAAGDDVYIMACNGTAARFTLGLVDAARIGPDCGTQWTGGTEGALHCAIMRANINGLWWWNDPDVYYLRDDVKLTSDEKLFFATVTAMTGGLTLSSDLPAAWSDEALSVYTKIVPPAGKPFRPVGFSAGMPSVLCINPRSEKPSAVVTVLHWDSGGDIVLNFNELGLSAGQPYHIYDFWKETPIGVFTDTYVCPRGAAHSINQLILRPADPASAVLVGDTTHVISSVETRTSDGVLRIEWTCNAQDCDSDETFTVCASAVPEAFDFANCRLTGIESAAGGIRKIHVTASPGRCSFRLKRVMVSPAVS